MSITDELRVYTEKQIKWVDMTKVHYHELFRIADRIDAEHQKALDEWKAEHGQMWLKGYLECHAELMEGSEVIAADLEKAGCIHYDPERHYCSVHGDTENGWVKLPEDADGVPIHIGDSIEIIGGEYGTAVAIELCEDGGWNVSMRPTGWDTPTLFAAESVRHYKPPTVEDVLREMCIEIDRRCESGSINYDELFAEYAAKLRLAGEE